MYNIQIKYLPIYLLIVCRSTRESYGDSAIGYVELLRQGNICLVKGQICLEHRVRQNNYKVSLTVDEEEEKIVDVNCDDCAASLGIHIYINKY